MIRVNANVYECDGPGCEVISVLDGSDSFVRSVEPIFLAPDGWYVLLIPGSPTEDRVRSFHDGRCLSSYVAVERISADAEC